MQGTDLAANHAALAVVVIDDWKALFIKRDRTVGTANETKPASSACVGINDGSLDTP